MVAISVGLPFHNARSSLAAAVRSVFAQTFQDWELILVDDGSTDGSLAIARSLRDPRVRVLADGKNRHLAARLNEIASVARGDLVARLDADDMMHPERLERQARLLADQAAVDFVGTGFYTLGPRGELGLRGCDPVNGAGRHVLRHGLVAHATMLARRAWLRANPYDERFWRAEDLELYCRTLGVARFAHIPDPLYFVSLEKPAGQAVREYVASSRDNRRIFLRHGPRLAGGSRVASLLVESFAKEAVFRVFTAVGLQRILMDRRGGRPLNESERGDAEGALARIRGTQVEGL